jgi:L-lactate dehydrogenase complex protein LldF
MTEATPIRILDNPREPSFRPAMDYLIDKRAQQFPDSDDFERLRVQSKQLKQAALSNLPALLEQAEAAMVANGIQVHWAETIEEAQATIHQIMLDTQATTMVKGKSMVSEEIYLNHHLEAHGLRAVETDMGEFIVQLAGETPSHIIMPAIHKSKEDIAALFQAHLDVPYTLDVDELIAIGREQLRTEFEQAGIGLSGVNFIAADTGTLCLVENEGNGRLSTTAPDVHVAITGIEKVVAHLADVPKLIRVLTRSATGQPITTYVNWIHGPRKPEERDGPRAVHLVLLDNGRSQLYQKERQQESLQCIRCGACMNHCPVYTRIGGHAYNTTYPGPIGKILSPHLTSLPDTPDHPKASTLCGACHTVCPVGIPITDLLLDHRAQATLPRREQWIWRFWSMFNRHPRVYRMSLGLMLRLYPLLPKWLGGWTRHRAAPALSHQSLGQKMAARPKKGVQSGAAS